MRRGQAAGIAGRKLRLVPNGIAADPPPVSPAPWDDSRIRLLFVGRFDRQKGLDILLDAVRPLGDRVALRVVGAPAVSETELTADLPPHVSILGWLSREQVSAQMAACDLLVVPSRWEGFGLVAVEAMRLGTAVMASDVGGLSDILGPDRFGFSVPAGDPQAWRNALAGLDRTEIARRAAAGQARFRDCYTADRMMAGIDAVYRELRPAG